MTTPTSRAVTGSAKRPSLRRRYGRFALRVQGHLDGDLADRVVPWAAAAGLFVVFLLLELAVIRSQEGGSGMAAWLQAAWRRQHAGVGRPVGGVDPAWGSGALVAEPILYLARFVSPTAVFAAVQAGALAIGVVPLWRLARRDADLRAGAAFAVLTAYALAPTLHRTDLTAFHPEVIALPALLAAYRASRRGQWVIFMPLVVLVLLCRADLGITVAALGLLLVREGRRRAGVLTAVAGLAWSGAALALLRPHLPSGNLTPVAQFVARIATPLAVVPRLVTHPVSELHDLFSEPAVLFLVVVLAPLLFLPLVSPRELAPALPCLALAVLAGAAVQRSTAGAPVDLIPLASTIAPGMAFVFIATVFALARIGRRSVTRINVDRRVLTALVCGAALLFLVEAPSSPYRTPWRWGSVGAVGLARKHGAGLFDPRLAVAASPEVVALVAQRARVVELPLTPIDIGPIPAEVRGIVLDTTGVTATGDLRWPADERRRALGRLGRLGFAVAWRDAGIYVLER
ncbi:MAG: putative rane protein [Acidimicrobiales bacterium]|nr:putative rane protein [Acidimicrobiales bacterium]